MATTSEEACESGLPTKTSIGVLLCRRNAATGRLEVLLVRKRYTYAFAEFVHGRYLYRPKGGGGGGGRRRGRPASSFGRGGAAAASGSSAGDWRAPPADPCGAKDLCSAKGADLSSAKGPGDPAAADLSFAKDLCPAQGPAAAARGDEGVQTVAALLRGMTTEELLDVWSGNFDQMWYRVWLGEDHRDLRAKKAERFAAAFGGAQGREALRRLVAEARSAGAVLWEAPKGRRASAFETDMACAVRELEEETGVRKEDYTLLPGVARRLDYVSAGSRYVCTYFLAVAGPRLAAGPPGGGGGGGERLADRGRPVFRDVSNMGEVSEARWFDAERLRLVDAAPPRLAPLVAPAFSLVRTYLRGRWDRRRPGN